MGDLVFDPCCGCIELKKGCFIIGYLELIAGVAGLILTSITLNDGITFTRLGIMEIRETGIIVVVFSVLLLLSIVLFFAFTIALLIGLHKNKPGYLKAFLVYGIIFTVISGIYIIAFFANGTATAATIAEQFILFVLNIYFLLVIRSQYYVMKEPPPNGPVVYTL